jgi:uncharacterized RDD family membrane protein YckC
MADAPKDPLAEHPLGEGAEPAPRRRPKTLELFPDLSATPLGEAPDSTPREAAASPTPAAPVAEEAEDEDVDEPGEEVASDGSEAVALARRIAAGLADLVILALLGAVELSAGAFLLELRFPPAALSWLGAFLTLTSLVLLVLVPFVWGTTPGMALADLKVSARDGGSPTLLSCFVRYLGFVVTGALAGVPLLVAAFDKEGRTPADLLSKTTVAPADRAR